MHMAKKKYTHSVIFLYLDLENCHVHTPCPRQSRATPLSRIKKVKFRKRKKEKRKCEENKVSS